MSEDQDAAGIVYPDLETGLVVARFVADPDDPETMLELSLAPEVAREMAFQLTRCSYMIEENKLP